MFERVLSEKAKQVLEILGTRGVLENFYLAGGSGIALHLGHRISEDLDFFTDKEFDNQQLIQRLKASGSFLLAQESWGTVVGNFNEVKISFFTYKYPLLNPLQTFSQIKVAHVIDIALMKIAAISGRGSKRDFIDLYLVCKNIIPLGKLLKLFDKKYKEVNYSCNHLLRSLCFFADAEEETLPKMLIPLNWEEVKLFFEKETKRIGSEFLR